jgi:exodeoxyribonuclease V gamma subunit
MSESRPNLIVHRDSCTEVLADTLARSLAQNRPENPLAPQTVVVAHPGLRRWLLGEFARRDERGIAANFDMILPWQWLERAARTLLGDEALVDGGWRIEALRWHIHAALPTLDAAPVSAYLAGEDGERRRFQLAEHLAGIYTQYLIYRPQWLLDWERGVARDDWQAALWRRLRLSISQPHRAQRREALIAGLAQRGDGESLPLHVFGVSHLAPDVLDALHALASHRPVHVYFPDPCREYWADFRTRREVLRLQPESDDLYYEIGHPLLVSLGRMAQDFFIQLDARGVELGADEGEAGDTAANTLLGALQASIRDGDPARVTGVAQNDDASLRVHACHTRLRELEVLKDALLGLLADDATLQHRDIVVMAPGIAAYAPYLGAVFGEPARYSDERADIPWHLADVGLALAHPLIGAFSRALDLADSRFAVSEILDFLDVPALARRFGVDSGSRDTIERLLRGARVAWGLDASMKAQTGAAALDENSWAFGFDRLYAGLIAGGDTDGQLLDGVLPLPGVDGGDGEIIGRLDRLLDALRSARDGLATPRTLLAWRDWLLGLVDDLFVADVRDDGESRALETLRRTVAAFGDQADAAGHEPLPWRVVREAVRGELDKVSERQAFLLGGVTFCGLVPQRSIPFRVVCLLGMNEGEYPRRSGDAGLNRMLENPRRGDRDTRREDRQLFLEALMAARAHLHISFIGEGVQDGKRRNPASPVAELLQFLDERHAIADAKEPRPWLVRHPLQPFDMRYFDHADARLFSFNVAYMQASVPGQTTFVDIDEPKPPERADAQEVSLAWLTRYWRDPAKARLRDAAGLSLEALDVDVWPDREPLKAALDRRERVESRLLFDALLGAARELPASPPDWLARSGILAAGAIGARAYLQARERAQAALVAAREFLGDNPQPFKQSIQLDLGDGIRLTGSVDAFRRADGGVRLFGAKPAGEARFNELLPFYLSVAALRLSLRGGVDVEFVEFTDRLRRPAVLKPIIGQGAAELRAGLRRMIDGALVADDFGSLFPPRTAWAWTNSDPAKREEKARAAWEGGFNRGERDYSGYAALVARDWDFLDPRSPAHARFAGACELVAGALDPGRTVLLRESARSRKRSA